MWKICKKPCINIEHEDRGHQLLTQVSPQNFLRYSGNQSNRFTSWLLYDCICEFPWLHRACYICHREIWLLWNYCSRVSKATFYCRRISIKNSCFFLLALGAPRVRELPPEQFCKQGFVMGKASEAGFGNEMYKILTAAGLSIMLNRSLIIGQTRHIGSFSVLSLYSLCLIGVHSYYIWGVWLLLYSWWTQNLW